MADESRSVRTFEDLRVWREARRLRIRVSGLLKSFPSYEKYKLVDQLHRATRSVTANIAEGYGRFHHQENIQYCRQARGSLYEVLDHLICAYDEKYINQDTLKSLKADIQQCIKQLNGYIKYLRRAKAQQQVKESDIYYQALNNQ